MTNVPLTFKHCPGRNHVSYIWYMSIDQRLNISQDHAVTPFQHTYFVWASWCLDHTAEHPETEAGVSPMTTLVDEVH